jgi:cytochrome c oxidase assembly protein subunit 15
MLEHGHRIMGAIVGLLAFLLALALFAADRRLSVRVLGMLMVLTVVGQGLLGRYRVTLNALWGRELAAVHACVAAICLLMMAAIVCATSKRWFAATQVAHDETARLRAGGVALCLLIYVQFIAGAALRHLGTGLAWHLAVAAVSVLLVLWLAVLVLLDPPLRIALAHPATLLLALVIGEVLLGLSAFLANGVNAPGMGTTPTHAAALVASLHQVVGALLLAAALSFALAAFRRLQPVPPATRPLAAAKFVEAAG